MKEPFTDLISQLSANDISNLQFLDDQDLKLKMAAKSTRNLVNVVKAAFLQNRYLRNVLTLPCSPRRGSTLLNQLSEYANSILKIEVEKSGLEDKIEIGSLSTIQLETERHLVEIFGSRSSVGVDLHHMRGQKGWEKYPEAIVQSLRNNGLSI